MIGSQNSGFSLVELLVALVVGSIMAYALMNAQQYSLYLAADQERTWSSLNRTQELLATELGPEELIRPTGTWRDFSGHPEARWRTTQSREVGERFLWIDLETEVKGKEQKWSWPVPK